MKTFFILLISGSMLSVSSTELFAKGGTTAAEWTQQNKEVTEKDKAEQKKKCEKLPVHLRKNCPQN